MKAYIELMDKVHQKGVFKSSRTGVSTLSLFGEQLRFDLQAGFPLVTTKKVIVKNVINELLWFLRGDTNIKTLDSSIWNEWATDDGELGPIYGRQWVNWGAEPITLVNIPTKTPTATASGSIPKGYNQISALIEGIKARPNSRRHIVSAWNVADLPDEAKSPQHNVENGKMALAPCHFAHQYYVAEGRLSCHMVMRSSDVCIGLPYNIASYAFLTHMIAQQTGFEVGELIISFGDVHMYIDHVDGYNIQRKREPRPLPTLKLNLAPSIFDYRPEDFVLEMYEPWPAIKYPIAV